MFLPTFPAISRGFFPIFTTGKKPLVQPPVGDAFRRRLEAARVGGTVNRVAMSRREKVSGFKNPRDQHGFYMIL